MVVKSKLMCPDANCSCSELSAVLSLASSAIQGLPKIILGWYFEALPLKTHPNAQCAGDDVFVCDRTITHIHGLSHYL